MKSKVDIQQLFADKKLEGKYLKVSAPMVRYSKLEFRTLLRKNDVDLCFTPMIMADSFCQSDNARQNEFTTNMDDSPLIVQFASKTSRDMLVATEMVYNYCDGVDLNCGCPQKWAVTSGYGCAMLKDPSLLCDIVQTLKRNVPNSFSISLKLRLLQKDTKSTIDLCRQLEKTGVTFLTVHGRTPWQKSSEPADMEAVAEIKKSLQIPLIANGDVRTLQNADDIYELTKCDAVMAARGLLSNPTLYTGNPSTTRQCIQDWVDLGYNVQDRITFMCFHHHLTFMMEKFMRKKQRQEFNNFTKKQQVYDFLENEFDITPSACKVLENLECSYDDNLYLRRTNEYNDSFNTANRNGKFFDEFCNLNCDSNSDDCLDSLDIMGSSIFDIN